MNLLLYDGLKYKIFNGFLMKEECTVNIVLSKTHII